MPDTDNIKLSTSHITMTALTPQESKLSDLERILFEGLPCTYVTEGSSPPPSITIFSLNEEMEPQFLVDEWMDENGDDIRMYVSDEPEYIY